ncbi:unnamed protein product [Cladocopium goreaui]|uniref:Uncharacterized protein n=1 Tax=Cladocopium goreaui TaxID=2562237 RepID=A0A9P1CZV9_9DINO|nr:unnamed protein product [Cladocopium goreaui]
MAMAAMAMEESERSERSESQAAVKEKDEREERCAEASARSLCIATGMMITAATRPAVILAIKGDRAANTMGHWAVTWCFMRIQPEVTSPTHPNTNVLGAY